MPQPHLVVGERAQARGRDLTGSLAVGEDMKKSTIWLIVGIISIIMLSVVGCCTLGLVLGDSDSNVSSSAVASTQINLEKLTKAFEDYVNQGSKDLNQFEKTVNDKSKDIYDGPGHVDVTMGKSGAVIGYKNKNTEPTYEKDADEKVFELNVDKKDKRVVARDRHNHYYRHRPSSGFFTGYLVGSMLSSQRSYYGGRYYRAPSNVRYQRSGYYSRVRSGSRSRSFRSGSRSRSSRSGSRSGGFGFGK